MVFITLDMLRRRAEHNEMCLTTLKEISLHQQKIEKLEVIGDCCRQLEIIYLCNNYIPKIENLFHLKHLSYLNLAINNIKVIEGLEGCEMLKKLDLTLNFVEDITSVANLRANAFLTQLYLTGNPCTKMVGYRGFVLQALPQLLSLDGDDVHRGEKIEARQDVEITTSTAEIEAMRARENERIRQELIDSGVDPCPPTYNDVGERVYGHSAEERMAILRSTEEEEEKRRNPPKDPNSISAIHEKLKEEMKPKRYTAEEEMEKYGRLLYRNEGKVPFKLIENDADIVVEVEPGKFISTSLITVDAQQTYVRVTIKGKLLQVPLPFEVSPAKASVQRSQTTGQLKITLPLAAHILQERAEKKRIQKEVQEIWTENDKQ